MAWTPFCFASLRMLSSNRCGFFSQLELSGLSGSPSVLVMVSIGSLTIGSSSLINFSSGECGNAILQYCYGVNRLSYTPQGLLHSVYTFSSGECGNALLQYCYDFNSSHSTGSPSLITFSSGECGNAILQYCYGFKRLS